ncbi:MAG: hypothetical protein ACFFBS_08785 [Promethearchaeota archaeon]
MSVRYEKDKKRRIGRKRSFHLSRIRLYSLLGSHRYTKKYNR